MNLRQIEVFKAVMETGTVTGAAKRLYVSQPAVSKQLRQLEEQLAFPLFERVRGRLIPTTEARALYDQVDRVYTGLHDLERFSADLKATTRGRLSIGALPILCTRWLPRVVGEFLHARPDVGVSLHTRRSLRVAEWVSAGQVDLGIAITSRDYPGVVAERLMSLEVVCVMAAIHRLTSKKVIAPEDLGGETFIRLSTFDRARSVVDRTLEEAGVEPRTRVDTFMTSVACALAAEGVGATLVDCVSAEDHLHLPVAVRPFRPRIVFEIKMLRPAHGARSHLLDAFLTHLRRAVREDKPGRPKEALFDTP